MIIPAPGHSCRSDGSQGCSNNNHDTERTKLYAEDISDKHGTYTLINSSSVHVDSGAEGL